MLTSVNRMIGLPVVWQDKQCGQVERAVADMRTHRLSGIIIRRGIGGARWVPAQAVLLLGRRSLIIREKPTKTPDERQERPTRAFLTSGERAGEVTDVLLDGHSLRIAALELSAGPIYRLMGQRSFATDYHLDGDQVILSALMPTAELLRVFGEEEGTC